jgi:hypothetical protein
MLYPYNQQALFLLDHGLELHKIDRAWTQWRHCVAGICCDVIPFPSPSW